VNQVRSITPERVLQLKAEARQLKDATGIKQTAALARIAQREGFSSWVVLVHAAGGRDALDEARREQHQPTEGQIKRQLRRAFFQGRQS
jgi:hypothetical protein